MIVKIKKYPVTLRKTDTCLTYALKRIGLDPVNYGYDDIEKDFDVHPFFFGPKCNSGVLLMWDANVEEVDIPWHISQSGRIISLPVKRRIHIGVYEGDGLVSDCSRGEAPSGLPKLKLRHINDIRRQPDKILIYKHLDYGKTRT